MTNTGNSPTEDERPRRNAEARRRWSWLTTAGVVLLVATVPAAFVIGTLLADGERDGGRSS